MNINKKPALKKCFTIAPNSTEIVDQFDASELGLVSYEAFFMDLSSKNSKVLKADIWRDDQETCEQVYGIGGNLEQVTFNSVIDNGTFRLEVGNQSSNAIKFCYTRQKP